MQNDQPNQTTSTTGKGVPKAAPGMGEVVSPDAEKAQQDLKKYREDQKRKEEETADECDE